jgi:hypothetical protein
MIPKALLADIDALVGQGDRNDFLVEVLRSESPSASSVLEQSRTASKR